MNAPPQIERPNMTDAEWQARCDLAALYRITDLYGWTDTIDTHMSVRIPGEPNCFLINNYGDLFDEITASNLVKMDIDGKVYSEGGKFQRRRLHHPQRASTRRGPTPTASCTPTPAPAPAFRS